MQWSIFHNYRRLVIEGKAKPIECPDCSFVLVTQPDQDANPVLWCIRCDVRLIPGIDLYDQMKAIVGEHYV
jgi:hypothetical protein